MFVKKRLLEISVLQAFILSVVYQIDAGGYDRHHDPPNIVIFLADDMGFGDLGAYGHPTSSTPNLDKMAEEGLVFTQFYTSASLCSPSRASLLTGRYPIRSGIYPNVFLPDMTGGLSLHEKTIAEVVKERGYNTSIVGKWHLGVGEGGVYLPTNQGFDEYLGIPYSNDMCPCCRCFYPDDPCRATCAQSSDFVPCPLFDGAEIVEQPVDLTTLAQRFVRRATSFIRRSAMSRKPFFLYFPFHHPHTPQFAGRDFRNATRRGTYGDSLAEMDWCVGSVLAELRRTGVVKNTLVMFMSDHGPSLVDETRGGSAGLLKCGKGTTYEGGQRAPAIAYWPGRIAPGRTLALASNLDILPTITKLVRGTPPPVPLDGYDMSSILFGGQEGLRETFAYYPVSPSPDYGVFAIRNRKYKAHFFTQGNMRSNNQNRDIDCRASPEPTRHDPPLLFDLDQDPGESYNISSSDPEYAVVVAEMVRLKRYYDLTVTWGPSQTLKPTSDDVEPCCDRGCSPFPQCCQCHRRSQTSPMKSSWMPSSSSSSSSPCQQEALSPTRWDNNYLGNDGDENP